MDATELLAEIDKMIATVAGADPAGLPGWMLGEVVLANERLLAAVTTYTAVVGAAFAERGEWESAPSPASWIAARTMTDPAQLRTRVRVVGRPASSPPPCPPPAMA